MSSLKHLRKLAGIEEKALPRATQRVAESSPEVSKHLVGGAERFWELTGVVEGPCAAYGAGWDLPEWGSGNERPLEAETAAWKLAVTKDAPKPEKAHQYDAETGQDSAYQSLSQALDALKLPTSDGKGRKVDIRHRMRRDHGCDQISGRLPRRSLLRYTCYEWFNTAY